ncbi:hypothetical protein [Hymenobacter properus]|uniref:DUF2846 domain-containing protein n=1 Tax=Hymenobacter properus TaxID=2791026 RepID=A0A931BH07_9BACT|nr:hypothetical protein [Hymenobacter properus]MBF9143780.1 hypothetical protein [Hymenobacter properus]MBR7722593.1 hypothetical protein [Microvirga sp. SRT04]
MPRLLCALFAVSVATCFAGCSPKMGASLTAEQLSAALPAGTPYAVVHLYRPGRMTGFAIGYDVRLNDSVVYRARNSSRLDLQRSKPGPVLLSAKTEARSELTLTVEPGREYYVQCSIGMGALVGRPHLQQVSVAQGTKELASISGSK